jgi:putative ATP-binding cassette transporter
MKVKRVFSDQPNWARFMSSIKRFSDSETRGKVKLLFVLLIALSFAINSLNVANSYVGRYLVVAIENRSMVDFIWQAGIYVSVFAASTSVAVFCRFAEERLGLLWREWLTSRLVNVYLNHQTYYRLDVAGIVANPDQRIAEDVRVFTATTLSFLLMLLNASLTIVLFTGVMWSISPLLFGVAVFYAALGSFMTIFLGRPLVRLNYDQLDKEANFRADLIHIRENAESVALLHHEDRLQARLLRHLMELTANFQRIIAVNRNLGFLTTGYNYLFMIIPALIMAPLFIRGQVEFGVIVQSAIASMYLLRAISLVITQFQSISSCAAVIARLGSLMEAIDQVQSTPISTVEVCEESGHIAYEQLTLRSPRNDRTLVKELSVSIPAGIQLLIVGQSETAKAALFQATAGIWRTGEGRIIRPRHSDIFFLPENPYLPPGTLREVLLRTGQEYVISDDQFLAVLGSLDLERVLAQVGGLDVEKNWSSWSLSDQKLLTFARLILATPQFAFLDRPGTVLAPEQVDQVLEILSANSITCLTLGNSNDKLEHYDAILEISGDGSWQWRAIRTDDRSENRRSSFIKSKLEVHVVENDEILAYRELTLRSRSGDRILAHELSIEVPRGTRLLIRGQDKAVKTAFYKVIFGTWPVGKGSVIRPRIDKIDVLNTEPQFPHIPLREVLLGSLQKHEMADDQILDTLRALDLESVWESYKGLNWGQDWNTELSTDERQLLAFAHILLGDYRVVFLNLQGTALSPGQVDQILKMLDDKSITYINVAESDLASSLEELYYYDAILEFGSKGDWQYTPL